MKKVLVLIFIILISCSEEQSQNKKKLVNLKCNYSNGLNDEGSFKASFNLNNLSFDFDYGNQIKNRGKFKLKNNNYYISLFDEDAYKVKYRTIVLFNKTEGESYIYTFKKNNKRYEKFKKLKQEAFNKNFKEGGLSNDDDLVYLDYQVLSKNFLSVIPVIKIKCNKK